MDARQWVEQVEQQLARAGCPRADASVYVMMYLTHASRVPFVIDGASESGAQAFAAHIIAQQGPFDADDDAVGQGDVAPMGSVTSLASSYREGR